MYSDSEMDAAVAAGVLSAQHAAAFRAFVAQQRTSPDEEQFRLLSGFNDIFVSIALAALLMLSAFWHASRKLLVSRLPVRLREFLPAT